MRDWVDEVVAMTFAAYFAYGVVVSLFAIGSAILAIVTTALEVPQ